MFKSIRKAVAIFLDPDHAHVLQAPAGIKDISHNPNKAAAKHIEQQTRKHDSKPLVGDFHVSHLDNLASDYLKSAISNLGAWSCLARAFAEYERVIGGRSANEEKLGTILDEFHCWNASLPEGKQMDDEAILLAVDKMATTKPPKGSNDTDAIIARVRKISIEEVKDDRQAKADKQTAQRKELVLGFTQAAWSFTSSDMNPSIQSAKAAAKAIQTLEWVANSWNGDPSGIAAELLLIERDIKLIEKMARDEESKGDDTFVQGTLTADGLIRNEISRRRHGEERGETEGKLDKRDIALDLAAFQAWQREQAN